MRGRRLPAWSKSPCWTSSSMRTADGGTLQQTRHAQPAIFAVEMGLAAALAVVGLRTRRGVRTQRRPVLGGLRRGCVQPRGRRPAAGRAGPAVRRPARRRADVRDLRRPGSGRAPHRRVPEPVGGRIQRRQHRAVRAGSRSGAGGGAADGRRCALRLARDQPRLPLVTAGSRSRRVRVLCERLRIRLAATDSGVQPDRGRPGAQRQTRRRRTGAAMLASRSSSPRAWPPWPNSAARCCSKSARSRCSPPRPCGPGRTRRPPPRRSRRCAATAPTTARSSRRLASAYVAGHLPDFGALVREPARKVDLPTYPFQHRQYWFDDNRGKAAQSQRHRRAHRSRPASRGRPVRGTRRIARRRGCGPVDRQSPGTACRPTQQAAKCAVHRGCPLRGPLGEAARTAPRRTSGKRLRGFSSAMTPM